jgi:hypothetical protein
MLEVRGSVTDISASFAETTHNYSWKVSRLTGKHSHTVEQLSYHPTKQYLYLLTSLPSPQDKLEKHLWVYDLRRECMIMSPLIKPGMVKALVQGVWVTDDPS